MTVTKIVPSQRQEGICHVYIDGKYLFSCPDYILSEKGVIAGREIDEGLAKTLSEGHRERKAINKAYELLSYRDLSHKELDDKLKSRGFTEEERKKAAEKVLSIGALSDERFAKTYSERLLSKGYGRRRVVHELVLKGVDKEIIEALLQDKLSIENTDAIAAFIEKKLRGKSALDKKTRDSIIRNLISKGFEYSDIKKALSLKLREEEDYEYIDE